MEEKYSCASPEVCLGNQGLQGYIPSMTLSDIDYTRYAELLIDSGINLKKGMNLRIRFHAEGILLARRCAEIAYQRGAGIVDMELKDNVIIKARIDAQTGDENALAASPGWISSWEDTVIKEGWGFLALESFENPGALADCNQEAVKLYSKYQFEKIKAFRNAVSAHDIPWCVAGVPGPRWAEDVLGKGKTTEDLWAALRPILLLDRKNPAEAWKEKAAGLIARSKKLDMLALDSLHFTDTDTGTDLIVGLTSRACWKGGPEDRKGHVSMPNLPTEEVFTTPDRNRCDGKVTVTRPIEVRGTMIKGVRLEFADGILTAFSAEEGEEALENYISTDPGAKRLGEVALVGEDSPIAASGLLFNSILYDENASCHIALGSGYPSCLERAEELTDDDAKLAAACNVSLVHTDFMIGSPATDVTGRDRDGREVPIIRKGCFVI